MHGFLYLTGLIAAVGILLMIIAGINCGVSPIGSKAYWPWDQCEDEKVETKHGTGSGDPSTSNAQTCYPNGNDNGIYITVLLFTGLGMFVLASFCATVLIFVLGVGSRAVGGSAGLVGSETKTGLRTSGKVIRDSLTLRPGKLIKDSVKGGMDMGVREPLGTTRYTLKGKKNYIEKMKHRHNNNKKHHVHKDMKHEKHYKR